MLFIPANHNDINRYYRHTFVKFQETGDRLFLIQDVTRSGVMGVDQDGNEFLLHLSNDRPYELEYVLPHKSYFQDGNTARLLFRIPAKQYQRGVSEHNTKIMSLRASGVFTKVAVGFPSLVPFVNKQVFPTFAEATKHKQMESMALSPRFAISLKSRGLFLDQLLIGHYNRTKRTVFLKTPLFKSEVEQLIAGSGYKVSINE